MKDKVVVGLSGGVDSSVAAYLLKQQGLEVIGVTMDTWEDTAAIIEDAEKVANHLGIPYHVMNFKSEFKCHVMDYFVEEYLQGRTPNPCVVCNRYVKWESLLTRAKELGADYIATGHYAQIMKLPNGRMAIRNSVTAAKDQTYALYNLNQQQLAHTLMPVGAFPKDEIRAIAESQGIPVAHKADSQEICFIPDHDYAAFIEREANHTGKALQEHLTNRISGKGNFVLADGTVIGTHEGIIHYTVGQRKGLNLSMGHPVFVTQIRPESNEVVIGEGEDVFGTELDCNRINLMAVEDLTEPRRVLAKIRYGHRGDYCTITKTGVDRIHCSFEKPVRAITPGQSVVFYEEDHVFGGGVIL